MHVDDTYVTLVLEICCSFSQHVSTCIAFPFISTVLLKGGDVSLKTILQREKQIYVALDNTMHVTSLPLVFLSSVGGLGEQPFMWQCDRLQLRLLAGAQVITEGRFYRWKKHNMLRLV